MRQLLFLALSMSRGGILLSAKNSCKLLSMPKKKNPAAVALGRRGAKKRNERLTAEQRSEIARKAVQARWEKAKKAAQKVRKER